ncbi:MAG: hypothetical protein ACFFDN_06755 [Candidatus Hodarchaeota archaeon]
MGYSSNQHWALFAAKTPDDIGYFTDWNINTPCLTKVLNMYIKHTNIINPIVNIALSKAKVGKANIPVGLKKYFINKSIYPLSNQSLFLGLDPIFREFKFYNVSKKNEFNLLKSLAGNGVNRNSFIVINSLDSFGHIYLKMHDEYISFLGKLLSHIESVISKFIKEYGEDGTVVLLSDHGMSRVYNKINLSLEDEFGPQKTDRYLYFLDSLILRIWIFDGALSKELEDFLLSRNFGHLLSTTEREYYGVTNKLFGDLIFILNEGYVFAPNYFGFGVRGVINGMHGYLPDSEMQKGVLLANIRAPSITSTSGTNTMSVRNIDVLPILKKII